MTTEMPKTMENSKGHFVPVSMIDEIDLARTDLVGELVDRAQKQKAELVEFKSKSMADFVAFVQLSAEQYGATLGGVKGNTTLTSYDGRKKVQISIQENHRFDERVQAGKALFDECLSEWADESRDEIKIMLLDAFEVNKEGHISTAKVLNLCSYKIEDPRWKQGVQAIYDSMHVQGSTTYIRFYEREDAKAKWQAIPLELAAV